MDYAVTGWDEDFVLLQRAFSDALRMFKPMPLLPVADVWRPDPLPRWRMPDLAVYRELALLRQRVNLLGLLSDIER